MSFEPIQRQSRYWPPLLLLLMDSQLCHGNDSHERGGSTLLCSFSGMLLVTHVASQAQWRWTKLVHDYYFLEIPAVYALNQNSFLQSILAALAHSFTLTLNGFSLWAVVSSFLHFVTLDNRLWPVDSTHILPCCSTVAFYTSQPLSAITKYKILFKKPTYLIVLASLTLWYLDNQVIS